MTIRNGVVVLIVAVLIAVGGWYVFSHSQSLPHVLTENGDRQIKEDTDYYTVQAIYPNTTRLSTRTDSSKAADERALATIEQSIQDTVNAFKSDANSALTDDEKARIASSSIKYALSIGYHPYNSGSFVSYEFDMYQDMGGAHPINFYKTLMFDLRGNEVALGDLFTSGSDYLARISQEAKLQVAQQLTSRAGEEATSSIIAEGLAPQADNFSNFVDNDGVLTFFIPPYQAGPYAAGSFEVRMPLMNLKDILKPGLQ